MRRIAILLLTIATAMVVALPAGAKKPPKPDDPPPAPAYYTVEIAAVGGNGISTDCAMPPIVRRDGIHFEWYAGDGDPRLPDDMELNVAAPGLEWGGDPLSGCRDAGTIETFYLDGSAETSVGPGYFRITLEEDGGVAMLWIFETHQLFEEVALNKKRSRFESTGRTDFRMGGPYDGDDFAEADSVTIDDETITVTIANRPFAFVHYDSRADPMFVELSNWIQTFSLTITLTPVE